MMMMSSAAQQGIMGSIMFMLGPFQLSCKLEGNQLQLNVSSPQLGGQASHKVSLQSINTGEAALQIRLATYNFAPEMPSMKKPTSSSIKTAQNNVMSQKMQQLESYVKDLERRVTQHEIGPSIKRMEEGSSNERQLQELNGMLQEKLFIKEGDMVDMEQRLLEKEDLIKELADKLIVANQQKEEAFIEYEKILQNTIFSTPETPAEQFQEHKMGEQQDKLFQIYSQPVLSSQSNEPSKEGSGSEKLEGTAEEQAKQT